MRFMKRKGFNVLIIVVCSVFLFLTSCQSQNESGNIIDEDVMKEVDNTLDVETNELDIEASQQFIERYITDFLTQGYSKYYVIEKIEFDFWEIGIQDEKLEALVLTSMYHSPLSKKDPDSIPYIKSAKDKMLKETDSDKKKILQNEYEALVDDFIKPTMGNYVFKFTSDIKNGKIDEKSINFLLEQDAENGVEYIPAERVLP